MDGRYNIGDVVLGSWKLTRLIGEGSSGIVFEAERENFGRTYKAAIKIVTIPQNNGEIEVARNDGMGEQSITTYFRGFVEELVDEVSIMAELKGESNVVSYEDHMVLPHDNQVGWDIIIRMELLTQLTKYSREHTMTRREVIKLGIDICKALELCQRHNIIHRDIKPENIFVSDSGNYKLGDFGIARTVEKTTSGLSKKGTYTYMAPEVYKGLPYGSDVDIYSLGIVMYRLLNDNRTPFLPAYPAPISHTDRESALMRRVLGEKIPAPKNADGRLAEIVLKACAYKPPERYPSPMQMRHELEAILYTEAEAPIIYPCGDETPVYSTGGTTTEDNNAEEKTRGLFDDFTSLPSRDNAVQTAEIAGKFQAEVESGSAEGTDRSNTAQALIDQDEYYKAEEAKTPETGNVAPTASVKTWPKEKRKLWILVAAVLLCLAAAFVMRYVPVRTVRLEENGSIHKFNIYSQVIKSVYFKDDGSVDYYVVCKYDLFGNDIKYTVYDANDSLLQYVQYKYDSTGNPVKGTTYNSNGTISECDEYDSDGNVCKETDYAGDKPMKIAYYDHGTMYRCDEYNDSGDTVKTTYYNADGTIR